MSDDPAIAERVRELESQAAFHEEAQARLSDVVARQDREISELQAQVRNLAQRLRDLGEALPGAAASPADEVPPHY